MPSPDIPHDDPSVDAAFAALTQGVYARHMNTGAALMLTVGPEAGEVNGRVGGDPVYLASLDPAAYVEVLQGVAIDVVEFVAEDPTCDFQTVLMGIKVEG